MQEIETADGVVKRYSRPEDVAAATAAAARCRRRPLRPSCRPGCARRRLRNQPPTTCCARPIPPRTTAIRVRSGESIQLRARALQRGTLVHRLLQSLPDVAAERRRDAALRYLARNADDWTDADREALAERVLALIADPRFAPVFAAGSRAEVLDRRPAGAAGTAAGAGFGADRPAGGDRRTRS